MAETTTVPLVVRDDHHCFGCGRLNPHGLHLSFWVEDDGTVWTEWTPAPEQQGYGGIAHGGLITTVLDEVMGWVLSNAAIWAVTGRLTVSFRKPVVIGEPTRANARIVTDHGRKIDVAAELRRQSDGLLLAEGTGIFVRVPETTAKSWQERYVPRVQGDSSSR
ncbi:hypothetical protein BH23CHL5_BH23CHL5_00730 [soil metagenome]